VVSLAQHPDEHSGKVLMSVLLTPNGTTQQIPA
jgi:hypothetical protein